MAVNLDTSNIKEWKSVITLIFYILTNAIVLFPIPLPIFIPRTLSNFVLRLLATLRIIPPRQHSCNCIKHDRVRKFSHAFVRWNVPLNFLTAPLITDLFLLAISAIGRKEVHDGTLGINNIAPIDIIAFFVSMTYITVSIHASGILRYFLFKILQFGGNVGHKAFLSLYAFFFGLGTLVGDDLVILTGTTFLAQFTLVTANIIHPRAWIHTQLAVAKMSSAVLVSSNPANLIIASAFNIKFIHYTANMIIPVLVTAIILFPFLLYFIFADEAFIPLRLQMHELSEEAKGKLPINANIPYARGPAGSEEGGIDGENAKLISLEEIMNPFLDKGGAIVGITIIIATLITLLAVNATTESTREHPVFWITVPAAFILFCCDVWSGWYHRFETRRIARDGRQEVQRARAEHALREENEEALRIAAGQGVPVGGAAPFDGSSIAQSEDSDNYPRSSDFPNDNIELEMDNLGTHENEDVREMEHREQISRQIALQPAHHLTLISLLATSYEWCQESFPSAAAVLSHLPYTFVPFTFCMFVLVEALVARGWIAVFAYGWDHWVNTTGTVGALGGMGFLSVVLCNFAGTNISTGILLCRMVQAWQAIHQQNGLPISERTFWVTIYSMALGVNYGGFSVAPGASLGGLSWMHILARNHIRVRSLDFARVNLPIIAISMTIGCVILVAEVYISRGQTPYAHT